MGIRQLVPFLLVSSLAATAQAERSSAPPRCEVVMRHTPERAGQIGNTLFVNRCVGGCDITAVSTVSDARQNKSTIPYEHGAIADGTILHLPEWTVPDQVWTEAMACAAEIMRPYDVIVTGTDPGTTVTHHESLLTTEGSEIGLTDAGIGGISELSYSCDPIDNVISFVFGSSWGNDPKRLCHTIVHEAGHAFGLEHIYVCKDPMTYFEDCTYKYFRDEGLKCGALGSGSEWWVESLCMCSGAHENTHRRLLNVFGEGAGAYPPETSIIAPEDDATVASDFRVYGSAIDKRGLTQIEFWVNGWRWSEEQASEGIDQYTFRSPSNLPDGYLDIDFVAYNDLLVAGTASITVLKGAPCTSPSTCITGQECTDGRCAWPPPSVAFGEICAIDQDCVVGTCESNDDEKRCTESCYPSVADQCTQAADLECVGTGTDGICWPIGGGGGGCCSVDDTDGVPWLIALFTAVILLATGRRRRRDP